jgi:hypothetical protein
MTAHRCTTLPEPIIVDRFWRDRGGRAIYTRLGTFNGRTLIDIRTFVTAPDGTMQPAAGLSCSVRLLPNLAKAIAKALARAKALGLLVDVRATSHPETPPHEAHPQVQELSSL